MKLCILFLAAILSGCGGGGAVSSNASIVAAGDSITRRTGVDPIPPSYPDFVPGVIANLGRGGDTCTRQAPYVGGLFDGQPRGLLWRLGAAIEYRPSMALVLIGINDRNSFGVPEPVVIDCVRSVWNQLRTSGINPVALTYPPIADSTVVWMLPAGVASAQARSLNRAIRVAAKDDGVAVIELENISHYSSADGVHPDLKGAHQIADAVTAQIQRGF